MTETFDQDELIAYLKAQKKDLDIEVKDDNICIHSNIILDDNDQETCLDCGLVIDCISNEQEWRFYGNSDTKYSSDPSRVQYRKEAEKGIMNELKKYNIPGDVKLRANNLYNIVTKGDIKRGRSRLAIIFACVFTAYIELDKSKPSEELTEMFNLERREASRALTLLQTNYKSRSSLYISSYHYIPLILSKFNADKSHEENIKKIYNLLEAKDISKINGSNPKSISAGLVYYYLININKCIDPDTFSKIVGLSKITILKISKFISNIVNKEEE